MSEQELALIRQVVEEASAPSKHVYADWLDDQTLYGAKESTLPYALRWAADHGRHPAATARRRKALWHRMHKNPLAKQKGEPSFLPFSVYDALPPATNYDVMRLGVRLPEDFRAVYLQLVRLGVALETLRAAYERKGEP